MKVTEYHRAYWKKYICEYWDIPASVPESELNNIVDHFLSRDWPLIVPQLHDILQDPVEHMLQWNEAIEEEWDDHYRSVTKHEAS